MNDPATLSVDISDVALRLAAAVLTGMIVGLDREWRGKTVGIRTLGLVSLGSALVCMATIHYAPISGDIAAQSRIIQGVIQGVMTGIGFLGAGAILKSADQVQQAHGLTTAATVWVTAALGIACALATWSIVLIGVGLTLVVLVALHPIDVWFDRRRKDHAS
ncbi:MAG: MgtC/SapB family protein [Proteobacteria bacterium]|nr:MgtC/SapB family protein [Pseudomonadota bacterium]